MLTHADLNWALFYEADLAGTRFDRAIFGRTVLAGCASLHRALGLEEASHISPSSLDLATLLAGPLPADFLEGTGAADGLIALQRNGVPQGA